MFLLTFNCRFVFSQNTPEDILGQIKTQTQDSVLFRLKLSLAKLYMGQNDFNKVKVLIDELSENSGSNKNEVLKAEYLFFLSNWHYKNNNAREAANYSFAALKLFEDQKNHHRVCDVYARIGSVMLFQNKADEATIYYKKALALARKINYIEQISYSVNNLGIIYQDKKENKKALGYYLESLKYDRMLSDSVYVAGSYANIGTVYFHIKDYDNANKYFSYALKLYLNAQDDYGIGVCYTNLGSIFSEQKQYDKAIEYQFKAIEYSSKINDRQTIQNIYQELAVAYASEGDFANGYSFYERYSQLKDSLLNEESTKQVAEVQTKYETEKKEVMIQLLNKDKENQLYIIYSATGGLILVSALAFFVFRGYKQKRKANSLLKEKNLIIVEKNKDITDSIRYAKRIQEAIFPPNKLVNKFLPESFILFKPKDIVSGDFYWFAEKNGKILIAAVDCTGHGVPGAFMSIVGHNLLEQAINEKLLYTPSEILNHLNEGLSQTLRQTYEESSVRDGMDMVLCTIDFSNKTIQYSGANNPLWVVKKKNAESIGKPVPVIAESGEYVLNEIKADKQPIGSFLGEQRKPFTNHELKVESGDSIYLFSDGYADQFGGPKGKKFKYKQLGEVIMEIHDKPMTDQRRILLKKFEAWKGMLEQVDDLLVIGIRF